MNLTFHEGASTWHFLPVRHISKHIVGFFFFLIVRETLRIKSELLVAPRSGTFPVVEKMLLGEDISLIVLAFSALFSHRLFLLTFAEFRASIST